MSLSELLGVQPGITAIIGGGGKSTLLRTLGEELAVNHTVLLCTTTKIFPFSGLPCARNEEELEHLRRNVRFLCAGKVEAETGKLAALDVPMAQLAARFDYVLVEADGSAGRPLKAHAPHEPVIPEESSRTICVVGASGFGRPIARVAHRPMRYAQLAGVSEADVATEETEAAVLLAENLHDIVYVNQAETPERRAAAKRLKLLLGQHVLAGSLRRKEYFRC